MKKNRLLARLLGAAAIVLSLASCGKEDPLKPAVNVNPGDWIDIPASGETIEKEDLTVSLPAGVFNDGDSKMAITKIGKGALLGNCEKSQFYMFTLPKSGSRKNFSIKIKYAEDPEIVDVVVQSPGLVRLTGEKITSTRAIDFSYKDGEIIVDVPAFKDAGDMNPFFSIGLVESAITKETLATKGEVSNGVYSLKWPIYKTFSTWNDYKGYHNKILDFLNIAIPDSHKELKALKFNWPSGPIAYQVEEFGKGEDAWGQEVIDWIFSNFGSWGTYVRINARKMLSLVKAAPGSSEYKDYDGNLRQTMIHETFHYIHDEVYDPRWAVVKSAKGLGGDPWAMFSDAIACWTEKKVGNKRLSENTPTNADNVLVRFFPVNETKEGYQNSGYGMALFTEWLAKKTGDDKIHTLLDYQKEGAADLRAVYDKFLAANKIAFFNTHGYWAFASDVIAGRVDDRVNLSTIFTTNIKAITSAGKITLSDNVYPFGISVQRGRYGANVLSSNTNKTISIEQETEDLTTYIYKDSGKGNLEFLGFAFAGNPFTITVADAQKKGINEFSTVTIMSNMTDMNESPRKSSVAFWMDTPPVVPNIWSVSLEGDIKLGGNSYTSWINAGWTNNSMSTVTTKKVSNGYEVHAYDNKDETYEVIFTITQKGNGFGDVVNLKYTCIYDPSKSFSLDKLTLKNFDSGKDSSHGDAYWKETVPGGSMNLEVHFDRLE